MLNDALWRRLQAVAVEETLSQPMDAEGDGTERNWAVWVPKEGNAYSFGLGLDNSQNARVVLEERSKVIGTFRAKNFSTAQFIAACIVEVYRQENGL